MKGFLFFSFAMVSGFLSALSLKAQAPIAPKNLLLNGGFESSVARENLWNGVDAAGFLAGERGTVPILTAGGAISASAMPISVGVADMNGDGKLDILSMDVLGYLRIFFNSGTPNEPKFTIGELSGVFLTRTDMSDPILGGLVGEAARGPANRARLAPRIFPTNIMKSGKIDLIVGNYIGEVLLVPNAGSAQSPDFRQPTTPDRLAIPTTKDPKKRWGNVFAPCTWDLNKDGREDLILGEGSYSANNIHLLVNQGSGAKPAFDENNHFLLAYGDGMEQLSPAVVDYNGDGLPDLLVTERTGKIAVFLNRGEKSKTDEPPPELPFSSYISAGSSNPLSFGGISTIAVGDLNGDGFFDIVAGKTNGRIALMLNVGTKTEPKFGTPVELKGDQKTPPLALPAAWDVDYGLNRGNFYGYVTVVNADVDKNAEPPDGKACIRAGYVPSPNKIMPMPEVFTPAFPGFPSNRPTSLNFRDAPARSFALRQSGRSRIKTNTNYTLTFKVKGRISEGLAFIGWGGVKKLSESKIIHGERDSEIELKNEAREGRDESIRFSAGPQWAEVKKDFRVFFQNKELKDLNEASLSLEVYFSLPSGAEAYFDDFKIIERS